MSKIENNICDEDLPIFAAIDLGTNNCRLMIARPPFLPIRADNAIKLIDSFSRIVRLGEGISVNKRLTSEAINRTIAALRTCKKKLDRYDIKYARYVTTEACRQADNTEEFLAAVKNETGFEIEVITNEEEAKLALLGCSSLLSQTSDNAIVFDIGGGSTEFMWIKRDDMSPPEMLCEHRIIDWLSLDKGVMNLSEKFGGSSFAEMYFDEMVAHLVAALRPFDRKNKISERVAQGDVHVMSTSGTLTTIAAIHLKLQQYERSRIDGMTFSVPDLLKASRAILAMRPSERFANACIGVDRSDYIISGCAIFEAICSIWDIQKITVADRGVRDGIIISLMQKYIRSQI